MNTRRTTVLALACALALGAAGGSAFAKSAEFPLVSIENGYLGGYNLGSSDVGSGLDFAIGFALTDKLQAKLAFVQGDASYHSYRLFGLSYALIPRLAFTSLFGLDANAAGSAVGLSMDVRLLSNVVSESLQTSLKLSFGYIAPVASYDTGVINFGVAASIGF
jgi:hypothetical protein